MIRILKHFKDLNYPRKHDFKELEDSKDVKDPMRFFVRDWNKHYSYMLFIYNNNNNNNNNTSFTLVQLIYI